MMRFTQTVGVMVGMVVLAVTGIRAAELSAEDKADVATLTKFIEGPVALTGIFSDDFKALLARREPELKRLDPLDHPDATPWPQTSGMSDPTVLLSLPYIFSRLRDEIEQKQEERLYRAWLVMISRYRLFCDEVKKMTSEGEAFAGIPELEEMVQQEKAGTLRARAAAIEARLLLAKDQTLAEGKKSN